MNWYSTYVLSSKHKHSDALAHARTYLFAPLTFFPNQFLGGSRSILALHSPCEKHGVTDSSATHQSVLEWGKKPGGREDTLAGDSLLLEDSLKVWFACLLLLLLLLLPDVFSMAARCS